MAGTAEPDELKSYREANPTCSWEAMRQDARGRAVYDVIRPRLIEGQGGICAFCEIKINNDDPTHCRVEHFHPKSDRATPHNWALDWNNMIAVCMGGSQRHHAVPYAKEPLPENLSCDAHKDKMIQSRWLEERCEGWIINPLALPAFPRLFFLKKSTGELLADEACCAEVSVEGNKHPTTQALVEHTISMLNLNCDRLCEARKRILWHIERNKKQLRDAAKTPQQGMDELAHRFLRQRWPGFFTTIRFCLGAAAEQYLQNNRYRG
ncbi:retron system putative HNH endonuclease [Pseudomonas sp. LARHCG127]